MNQTVIQDITLLDSLPPAWPESLLGQIRKELHSSDYKIVILDDDPTGTQTVRNLPVLTHWSVDALKDELLGEYPAFFLLTNSRSLPEQAACELASEIGRNLAQASQLSGVRIIPISRSDSTLRGHFPAEVDAMARAMHKQDLPYLILPFFLEGGRYTINDIHYVREENKLVPAAMTPFAEDAAFGFASSDLRQWVEEKTGGAIKAADVHSISLEDIRKGGPQRVTELLMGVPAKSACIVNFAEYRDMEVFVAALIEFEKSGREFLYRTAASFVRSRTGQDHRSQLLAPDELISESANGGLFVIGSYVEKTSKQLKALLTQTDIVGIEIHVEALLAPARRKDEISRVVEMCSVTLSQGRDCALYTSRNLITGFNAEGSLNIGQTVSDSIIEIVRSISLQPRYFVAKGGITSSVVATEGLGVKRAMVLGQPFPGVPAWKLGSETKFPEMTYIVFPGNVGESDALVKLQQALQHTSETEL